eukprot:g24391.t1
MNSFFMKEDKGQRSKNCKNATPYSQFLRLCRSCSQNGVFHSQTSQVSSYFKDRNFPPLVVKNALDHISCVSRTSALTSPPLNRNKDRITLVLMYHTDNLQIQCIILRHFCHLQSDSTTKDIFPSPPLSAFRRDHSVRNSLVCSTLLTSPTTPSTFPCNHKRCYTCPYTSPLTSIQGPKNTFRIRQMFTCTSVNVVYCIRCSRCGLLDIGETKQRLRDHFLQHLRSVRNKRQHLPVANYFNSPFHCLDDMSILGFLQCHKNTTQILEEQHLIFHLGILQPNGLNVDFT